MTITLKKKFNNLKSQIVADFEQLKTNFVLQYYQVVVFYIVLSFAITSIFWTDNGIISYFHDWAFAILPENLQNYGREILFAYYDKGLGAGPTYSTSYLYNLIVSVLGFIGFNGVFLSKFVLSSLFVLAGVLSYRFVTKVLNTNHFPGFVASLFFTLNPFVFHRAVAGHIYFLLAYSIQLLFIEFVIKSFKSTNRRNLINNSLIASILLFIGGWQIQLYAWIIPVYGIFLLSYKSKWINKLYTTIIIFVLNLVYNSPWFVIFIFKRNLLDGFQGALSLNGLRYQSTFTDILSVLQIRDGIAPYYSFTFDKLNIFWQYFYYFSFGSIILSLTVGIYLGFRSKVSFQRDFNVRLFTGLFSILLLLTIFLAKGTNYIGGDLFLELYKNIQLFSLFREIYHYQAILPFIYLIFTSISLNYLFNYIFVEQKLNIRTKFLNINTQTTRYLITTLILLIPLGYLPIYFSPGLSLFLKTYDTRYQGDLVKDIDKSRVWFLPNYQPLTLNSDARYGGFDTFQAYGNYSALSQGDTRDVNQKTMTSRLNYCLIFDINCEYEISKTLNLIGIDKIVVQKNMKSLNHLFTPLGIDGSLAKVFSDFNYIEKLKSLGFELSSENQDYAIFNTQDSRPLITVNNKVLYTVGSNKQIVGSIFDQNSDLINIRKSSLKTLPEGDVLIFDNKKDLLNLELNKDAFIIEPGFFVDTEGWLTYNTYWWRKNFTSTGYNGVFTNRKNSTLDINFPIKSAGDYNVWVNLGQQDYDIVSNFEVSINSLNSQVLNNSENRNKALINLGTVKLNSGSQKLSIRNLIGDTMIDSFFIEPVNFNQVKENTNTNFFYLNYPESVNTKKSNDFNVNTKLDDYSISSYSQLPGGTEYEIEKSDNEFTKITAKFNPEEVNTGEFISLRDDLDNIPLVDFEKLDSFEFSYKTPVPDDLLVDFTITLQAGDEEKRVFYKRFDSLEGEGKLKADLNDLSKTISNNFFGGRSFDKNQFYVTAINLYLNKKVKKTIAGSENIFYISDPFYGTSKTKFLSQEDYIYLSNIFNRNFYFNSIFDYYKVLSPENRLEIKTDPLNSNQSFGPYRSDNRNTEFIFENNEFILTPRESQDKAEFGTFKIPLRYDQIKSYDSLVIPVEYDFQKSFIDGVFTATKNNEPIRSQVVKSTTMIDGKEYMLFDLKQSLSPFEGTQNIFLDLVMNKRLNEPIDGELKFKVDNFTFSKGYEDYFVQNNKLDVKQTFVTVNAIKEGEYNAEVFFDWGDSVNLPVNLSEGLNDIEIPPQSVTGKVQYVLISPKNNTSNLNQFEDLEFYKKDSTEYTFNLKEDQIKSDNLFINFGVAYDPDWQLFKDGKLVSDSFRGNLIFNAFNIENPEAGTYTLKYRLQNYRIATLGLVFSLFLAQLLWFGYQFANRKYGFSLPILSGKSKDKLKLMKK